jgi:hypothetical protein
LKGCSQHIKITQNKGKAILNRVFKKLSRI